MNNIKEKLDLLLPVDVYSGFDTKNMTYDDQGWANLE